MVLHREHSEDLLRIWRAQLDKEEDDGDNDAYLTAYHLVEREIAKMRKEASRTAKANSSQKGAAKATKPSSSQKVRSGNHSFANVSNANQTKIHLNKATNSKQKKPDNKTFIITKNKNSTTNRNSTKLKGSNLHNKAHNGTVTLNINRTASSLRSKKINNSSFIHAGRSFSNGTTAATSSHRLRRLEELERSHVALIRAILNKRTRQAKYKNLNPLLPVQVKVQIPSGLLSLFFDKHFNYFSDGGRRK